MVDIKTNMNKKHCDKCDVDVLDMPRHERTLKHKSKIGYYAFKSKDMKKYHKEKYTNDVNYRNKKLIYNRAYLTRLRNKNFVLDKDKLTNLLTKLCKDKLNTINYVNTELIPKYKKLYIKQY